jgi:ubiquinone/menaquinone biosynthesis C-methylase UbiE
VKSKDKGIIIDIGCGSGYFVSNCLIMKASTICAIDLNPLMLKRFKARIIQFLEAEIYYMVCDGTALPFKDNVFEQITCISVIEHVPNDNELLKEFHRVVHKNGHVIISTPGKATRQSLFSKLSFYLSRLFIHKKFTSFKSFIQCFDRYTLLHRHNYSPNQLVDMCTNAHLIPVDSIYFGGMIYTFFWELTKLRFLAKEYEVINLLLFPLFKLLTKTKLVNFNNKKPALTYILRCVKK